MSRGVTRLRPVTWRDALVLRILCRCCLHFCIGVNHGDVMSDGVRVYGDGLNVAARIQALAEPGGICVTALVREAVGARTSLAFAALGP